MKLMKTLFLHLLFCGPLLHAQSLPTPFELDSNQTATYEEIIHYYELLDDQFEEMQLQEVGPTDIRLPLHAVILNKAGIFERRPEQLVLFVNNGIHPGEPCGVDASMIWVRDLLEYELLPEDMTIVLMPIYNVGGALNRNRYSRANQLGPESHGFRGNARNYDLNRDFIKCDTKNAKTFNRLFTYWQPHFFVDTHTSNGADYQHTMTLIPSLADRLPEPMGSFMRAGLLPELYDRMTKKGWDMVPYVYARTTPDEGIIAFPDWPRYSSGYAALHHAYGFTTETHMLKPFTDRVWSTHAILETFFETAIEHRDAIQQTVDSARSAFRQKQPYALGAELDTSRYTMIPFKGYTADYKPSAISGEPRLYYDHERPFSMEIPYYEFYRLTAKVDLPEGYLIPAAYQEVIDRLLWNGIELQPVEVGSAYPVEVYTIEDYKTTGRPYEGHYLHSDVEVSQENTSYTAREGDVYVPLQQTGWRYILETLEPKGKDSFFAWNFMDAILQRKEGYSSYVFEDTAAKLLEQNADLRIAFAEAKKAHPEWKDQKGAALRWIYLNSPYAETTVNRYPILRVVNR
jgi:hypothetical protein